MNDFEQHGVDHSDPNLRPGEAPVMIMEDAPSAATPVVPEQLLSTSEGRTPPSAPYEPHRLVFNNQDTGGQTVMPRGWTLNGDIESSSGVKLAGVLNGNITMQSQAQVEICAGATMKGTVRGRDVLVRGELDGEIDAGGGKVSIEDTARIAGRVRYQSIRMEGGNHKMELQYAEAASLG